MARSQKATKRSMKRFKNLVKNTIYHTLFLALELFQSAQPLDPGLHEQVRSEAIVLLQGNSSNNLCRSCAGTGLTGNGLGILERLELQVKPATEKSISPGNAPKSYRWLCTLCDGQKHLFKRTNDLRKHLKEYHEFCPIQVKFVFSPNNEQKLYEHFGPFTYDQAVGNHWRVGRSGSFSEGIPSLPSRDIDASSSFGGTTYIDPRLTTIPSNDSYPFANGDSADLPSGADHVYLTGESDDPMSCSITSRAGDQFEPEGSDQILGAQLYPSFNLRSDTPASPSDLQGRYTTTETASAGSTSLLDVVEFANNCFHTPHTMSADVPSEGEYPYAPTYH